MEPVGDLLGDQGGVAAGAVADDEIHLNLVLCGLLHDFCVSSIISGSSIPGTILLNGNALA
jgi:hypothetical protein